jgi:putative addiction module killer protein
LSWDYFSRIDEKNIIRAVSKMKPLSKIDYGPGYRVYFGQVGLTVVLLLCGGDKSTQEQDISQAKKYWRDYERISKCQQLEATTNT